MFILTLHNVSVKFLTNMRKLSRFVKWKSAYLYELFVLSAQINIFNHFAYIQTRTNETETSNSQNGYSISANTQFRRHHANSADMQMSPLRHAFRKDK